MAGFVCPYCNSIMAIDTNTHRYHSPCFESSDGYSWKNGISTSFESTVQLGQHRTNAAIRIIQQVPNKNCG